MYTIYIPKYEKDTPDFYITETLERFMKSVTCDCIICSPGYMSTTINTINKFIDKLSNNLFRCPYLGFFNGMNGNNKVYKGTNTIREAHENEVLKSINLRSMPIQCIDHKDHRKMMFFIRNQAIPSKLDKKTKQNFLDNSTVFGILIGSSNQSLNTYYGGVNGKPADKGEADILMYFDDNRFTNEFITWKSNFPNIRISKSIDIENDNDEKEHKTDSDFFKKILDDFLENNLA